MTDEERRGFLEGYNRVETSAEWPKLWLKSRPLPFYYGILSKDYWRNFKKLLVRAIRGEDYDR